MKKILFIFIAAITLASCGSPTVLKTEDIPIEVVTIKEAQKFDTLLVIPTTNSTYVFNTQGEYQGVYSNTTDGGIVGGALSMLLLMLLVVLIGVIVFD